MLRQQNKSLNNHGSYYHLILNFNTNEVINYIDLKIQFKQSANSRDLNAEIHGTYNYTNNAGQMHVQWKKTNAHSQISCSLNTMIEKKILVSVLDGTIYNSSLEGDRTTQTIRVVAIHNKATDEYNTNTQTYRIKFWSNEFNITDIQIINQGYDEKYNSNYIPMNTGYFYNTGVNSFGVQEVPLAPTKNYILEDLELGEKKVRDYLISRQLITSLNGKEVFKLLRENTNLSTKVDLGYAGSIAMKYTTHITPNQGVIHPAYNNDVNASLSLRLNFINNMALMHGFVQLPTSFNILDYNDWYIKNSNNEYALKICQFLNLEDYTIDWDLTEYREFDNKKVYTFHSVNYRRTNPASYTFIIDDVFNLYVQLGTNNTKSPVHMIHDNDHENIFTIYGIRPIILKKKFKSSTSKRYLTPNFINKLMKGGRKYA